MPRRKRPYLRVTEGKAMAWGSFHARFVDEAGYPTMTVEARLMEGGAAERMPPGPRVPARIMMPPDVREFEHAWRRMPPDLAVVIEAHYRKGKKVSRAKVTEALIWLNGRGV